jgi:DNA-binding response OmpR family regulator
VTGTVQTVETTSRILIVEDDERIGSSLTRALSNTGYDSTWKQTGQGAIEAVSESFTNGRSFNLVLLDLGLPDLDGLEVCRRIVAHDPSVPVIMLTARDEELDMVVGLDSGAIDYITKPFSLAPLLARIRAQLRRNDEGRGASHGNSRPIIIGVLSINLRSRTVVVHDHEVTLRAKEFDLLARLATEAGAVVTREQLMSDVWDEHWFGSTKTLDFHIAALRARLDGKSQKLSMITTVRGVGFRLELAPPRSPANPESD